MMTNKYKACPFYLDYSTNQVVSVSEANKLVKQVKDKLVYFASKHEYRVYRQLQELSANYTIHLQPKIELIPPKTISCYPKGKYWKADFMVKKFDEAIAIFEAKGVVTKDFALTMALLELNDQELFNKLWLIFPSKIPQSLVIKRLLNSSMQNQIIKLTELKQQIKAMNMR